MRIDKGVMVALGYGKFFRSESIIGLVPIEEDRGPKRRTKVYVDNVEEPVIASRSENAILRDLTGIPRAEARSQEQYEVLRDILDTVSEINPLLRKIIKDQGNWDLDGLEERIRDILGEDEQHPSHHAERASAPPAVVRPR